MSHGPVDEIVAVELHDFDPLPAARQEEHDDTTLVDTREFDVEVSRKGGQGFRKASVLFSDWPSVRGYP